MILAHHAADRCCLCACSGGQVLGQPCWGLWAVFTVSANEAAQRPRSRRSCAAAAAKQCCTPLPPQLAQLSYTPFLLTGPTTRTSRRSDQFEVGCHLRPARRRAMAPPAVLIGLLALLAAAWPVAGDAQHAAVFFESFDGDWGSRWTYSRLKKYTGRFETVQRRHARGHDLAITVRRAAAGGGGACCCASWPSLTPLNEQSAAPPPPARAGARGQRALCDGGAARRAAGRRCRPGAAVRSPDHAGEPGG